MLLEDPKNPHNPNARVNPKRKQMNVLPPKEAKRLHGLRKQYGAAKYAGFVGSQLSGRFLSSPISNFIGSTLINADLGRYDRKRRKHMPVTEDTAKKVNPNFLRRSNDWVLKKTGQAKQWGLDNPIQATLGGIAATGLIQGVTGGIGSYIHHKSQMKTNPLYAKSSLDAKRQLGQEKRLMRVGRVNQGNPQGQGQGVQQGQGIPGMQQGPVLPSHAQVSAKKPKPNAPPDEARPNNQKDVGQHQPQNAYAAVMRGMDMNSVNAAGKAMDPKQFKLATSTKTNTRKEDYGPVDVVMEMVDRLDELGPLGIAQAAGAVNTFSVKPAKAIAFKVANAYTKPLQKATGKTAVPGKHSWSPPKMVKNSKLTSSLNYRDNIHEVWGTVASTASKAVGKIAGNALLKGAATHIATNAANSTVNRMNQKSVDKARIKAETRQDKARIKTYMKAKKRYATPSSTPPTRHESVVDRICRVLEAVGAGALSPYEFNRARTDSYKSANQLDRNTFINSTSSKAKRHPKNFNQPRKLATDDPRYSK